MYIVLIIAVINALKISLSRQYLQPTVCCIQH